MNKKNSRIVVRLPLRSLNRETLLGLQEKYPDAEVSVEVQADKSRSPLSEEYFWEIIDLLDWRNEESDDAIIEPAVAHLASGPLRHIFEFADFLSEKLYAFDSLKYAKEIGEDSWAADKYFPVDNFLYARCCVVANGREMYEKVLKDPAHMPKDLTFEPLLYIPSLAYERRTGQKYDYSPAFDMETYSNEEGWKVFHSLS
jgi:hypothetical protein